jgi:hypothetical protein
MDNTRWEIGVSSESLDQLLQADGDCSELWFLVGYLKGMTDSHNLQNGARPMVLEPDGERGWRLRCRASAERVEGPLA